jgi:hypothetical protein
MRSSSKHLFSLAAFSVLAVMAGCGTTPETRSNTTQQVRSAEATLAHFEEAGVRRALSQARPERSPEWRAITRSVA